jgi:hypothetical protein
MADGDGPHGWQTHVAYVPRGQNRGARSVISIKLASLLRRRAPRHRRLLLGAAPAIAAERAAVASIVVRVPDDLQLPLRRALEHRDVERVVALAQALAPLSLLDALAVLDVMAEAGDPRFPRWAEHWARHVERERRLEPVAVLQMRRFVAMMPEQNQARAVTLALSGYVRRERPDG